MTVKRIYPCVCIDHKPDAGDRSDYGMPDLAVSQSKFDHKQYWSAYCRNCGRGSRFQDKKSAYKALKDWNKIMLSCWNIECTYLDGSYKEDVPEWRKEMYEEMKRDKEIG